MQGVIHSVVVSQFLLTMIAVPLDKSSIMFHSIEEKPTFRAPL